jgi:hypothetical protein
MYRPVDLATFSMAEFERGLVGLTDAEARVRQPKADGSAMNAISWIAAHVAWQWLSARSRALGEVRSPEWERFAFRSQDPTAPSLQEAEELLQLATNSLGWIASADEVVLAKVGAPGASPTTAAESVGTFIMRTGLHTWFHIGEVNATSSAPRRVRVARLWAPDARLVRELSVLAKPEKCHAEEYPRGRANDLMVKIRRSSGR